MCAFVIYCRSIRGVKEKQSSFFGFVCFFLSSFSFCFILQPPHDMAKNIYVS